ncbi:MAG: 3-deoxy-D-manno-octulosonic acid transferase [Desulfocapsaceae bacterium]
MLALYCFIVGILFWISFPILLVIILLTGRHRRGLKERLAFYELSSSELSAGVKKRIWIHAASIGEVRAAGVLINCLKPRLQHWDFLVTTMTIHGRDFARQHLGPEVACHLAPLDVPYAVNRALSTLAADVYVCLETELWPVLINTLRRKGIPALLINGRLSTHSSSTYRRLSFLFAPVLQSFRSIGAISEDDRRRFIEVGADPDLVTVTGNIKDDIRLPKEPGKIAGKWSEILALTADTDVFIAGSTHSPEEELLLPLITNFISEQAVVIIAPRHLDRLPSIELLINEQGLKFDRLSELKRGRRRTQALVVVDTFGDLGEVYSVATFVFVGGSLSGSGGHNVMEPAIWERVVFFGPDMADFKEAAVKLENNGGGFRVDDISDLGEKMTPLMEDRDSLRYAQKRAGEAARGQQGAAERQALLVFKSLTQINLAE